MFTQCDIYSNAQCDVHIIIVYFLIFHIVKVQPTYSSLAPDVGVCTCLSV